MITERKLFIADRHKIFREGIKTTIKNSEFEVVGECSTLEDIIGGLRKFRTDILIMDYQYEIEVEPDFIFGVKDLFPELKMIMFTMNCTKGILMRYIQNLDGFLSKATNREHLIAVLEEVANGSCYYFLPNLKTI